MWSVLHRLFMSLMCTHTTEAILESLRGRMRTLVVLTTFLFLESRKLTRTPSLDLSHCCMLQLLDNPWRSHNIYIHQDRYFALEHAHCIYIHPRSIVCIGTLCFVSFGTISSSPSSPTTTDEFSVDTVVRLVRLPLFRFLLLL